MRTLVTLACTECKRRNYTTDKNKSNNPDRMELKKYCPWRSPKPFVEGSSPSWPARLNHRPYPYGKAGLYVCLGKKDPEGD